MLFASKCKPFHLSVVDGMNEYLNWFVCALVCSGDHELDSVCMSVGIGSVFEHGWAGRVCDSVCENVK